MFNDVELIIKKNVNNTTPPPPPSSSSLLLLSLLFVSSSLFFLLLFAPLNFVSCCTAEDHSKENLFALASFSKLFIIESYEFFATNLDTQSHKSRSGQLPA